MKCGHAAAAVFLVPAFLAAESSSRASLRLREPWSAVFGGREVVMHVEIAGAEARIARLSRTLAFQGRVIERRETAVQIEPGAWNAVGLSLRIPEVKEGVAVRGELSLVLSDEAGNRLASLSRVLWVFPENPFAGRTAWLTSLNIHLFDPLDTTAAVLESAGVPHERVHQPGALDGLTNALVLVGEGMDLNEHRGLAPALFRAAERGCRVLWLAPVAGQWAVPGMGETAGAWPQGVQWRGPAMLAELDKRLDAAGWSGNGCPKPRALGLRPKRREVVVEVAESQPGWAWLQVDYARGQIVICGWPVIACWDQGGPTPRYLLLRLLENLSERKESES